MEAMILDKQMGDRIFSAEFGEWNYREFLCLCLRERQSKAQYLRNLAVARTEANRESTYAALDYLANKVGISVDELKDWIVRQDSRGKSIVQMIRYLESFEGGELGDISGRGSDE